jgi:fucose permease
MASKAESRVVSVAGLVQGIVLVTFPAASTIFTSGKYYGLSSSQYGEMFLPQVAAAVGASLLGASLVGHITAKRVYLIGLASSLTSMALLIASVFVNGDKPVAYPLLLVATAFLGAGFGLTVPMLNTYATAFHPGAVDSAVLVLNALLGLGTVLAPVFVAVFVGLGFWWGLPIMSLALLAALLVTSARLPLRAGSAPPLHGPRLHGPRLQGPGLQGPGLQGTPRRGAGEHPAGEHGRRATMPGRFWLYAALAVLYGICETMNGNWSQLEMTKRLGASPAQASVALAAFWGLVTAGRVAFSAIGRWLPERTTYRILPVVLVVAFLLTGLLGHGDAVAGIAVFALAGLGCSALLPLTISFSEAELTSMSSSVAGRVIAFYQIGYGIAAFGVGPLQSSGVDLSGIFAGSSVVAAALAVLSLAVVSGRRAVPRR